MRIMILEIELYALRAKNRIILSNFLFKKTLYAPHLTQKHYGLWSSSLENMRTWNLLKTFRYSILKHCFKGNMRTRTFRSIRRSYCTTNRLSKFCHRCLYSVTSWEWTDLLLKVSNNNYSDRNYCLEHVTTAFHDWFHKSASVKWWIRHCLNFSYQTISFDFYKQYNNFKAQYAIQVSAMYQICQQP